MKRRPRGVGKAGIAPIDVSELFDALRGIDVPGMMALAVIGSRSQEAGVSNLDDIDVLCVLEQVTGESFSGLRRASEAVAQRFSTEDVRVTTEFRLGPFRPRFDPSRSVVQLHLLVMDVGGVASLPMCWQLRLRREARLLRGQPIPLSIPSSAADALPYEVLNGPDGLRLTVRQLEARRYSALTYVVSNAVVKKKRIDHEFKDSDDLFLFANYIAKAAVGNFLLLAEAEMLSRVDAKAATTLEDSVERRMARYASSGIMPENVESYAATVCSSVREMMCTIEARYPTIGGRCV